MRTKQLLAVTAAVVALMAFGCAPQTPPSGDKSAGAAPPSASPAAQAVASPAAKPAGGGAPATQPAPAQPAAAQPKKGGTLNMSLGIDFTNFDPFFDVDNRNFKPNIFEAPVRLSDSGTYEPWLAESVGVAQDGLSATLKLRKGVKFHNGREMTADDVVWNVDRARNDKLGHQRSDSFKTCTGATKIDDYTVKINYNAVTPNMLMALSVLYIIPKEAEKDIATKPVGTGPFMLQEWVPGDHATLVRFPDYWQAGKPYLDRIVIRPIPDEQSRLINLQGGSIDLQWGIAQNDKVRLANSQDISFLVQPPGFSFNAFAMNVTRKPFDNRLVRQALNYAVDRDKIVQTAFAGDGVATVLPFIPGSWAYPKDLANAYTFDLNKAKSLLAEAGYPNGFKTTMLIRGTGGAYLDQAQVFQADLAKIGVQVEILPTELAQYWPKLYASDFDLTSLSSASSSADPAGIFELAALYRPFRNFFQITEDKTWFPEYADVIQKAATELDQAKRQPLYHKAAEILVREGWAIPTVWRQDVFALRKYVKGVRSDLDGSLWLGEAWLDK